jgi:beta-lactamase regulating signal transducer with metallopeptidase domain
VDNALRLVLTNAAAAAAVAAVALVVPRVVRRPAVAHALWLLALVKLVTPPLVPLPLLPSWQSLPAVSLQGTPTVVRMAPEAERSPRSAMQPATPAPAARASQTTARLEMSPAAAAPVRDARAPSAAHATTAARLRLLAALALAGGAVVVLALACWRFARFRRLLTWATPAPLAIASRTAALAGQMGLRTVPPVLVVPAPIPPMLWPEPTGPRLLLPRDLLHELTGAERDALLAHELAHVRRRDHWVRLVEMLATALFWWYPLTWWARAALRRAEERCCDEWVLRVLPRSAEAYAQGLLKSLSFVSSAPAPVPALASGASPLYELELRLKEILMSRPAPRLAAPLRLVLLAAAVASLAVFPTHARDDEPGTPSAPAVSNAPRPATPARAAAPAPAAPAPVAPAPVAAPSRAAQAPSPASVPSPAEAPTPVPAAQRVNEVRRALEQQRHALDAKRRLLQQQELELQRHEIELDARAEQVELRDAAERLRAEGKARQAELREKQAEMTARRLELQRRQLALDAERLALQAKLEAEELAQREQISALEASGHESQLTAARQAIDRAEAERQQVVQELQRKHEAIQGEAQAMQKQMQRLAAEEQIHAISEATDEMARSLAEQAEALKSALRETGSRPDVEREIRRLEAALAALRAEAGVSAPPGHKPPAPQP